jgi:hypothetical protein
MVSRMLFSALCICLASVLACSEDADPRETPIIDENGVVVSHDTLVGYVNFFAPDMTVRRCCVDGPTATIPVTGYEWIEVSMGDSTVRFTETGDVLESNVSSEDESRFESLLNSLARLRSATPTP